MKPLILHVDVGRRVRGKNKYVHKVFLEKKYYLVFSKMLCHVEC